jgi:preprotein translocase subunit SecG
MTAGGFRTRALPVLFGLITFIFGVFALGHAVVGHNQGKDYPLWYAVGREALRGGDLYHARSDGTFDFLYPPFAALLLAPFSLFGQVVSILLLVIVNAASWWAAVKLSERLCGAPRPRTWLARALPSAICLPFLWDMFDLGQPNLMLLAIVLAGLALLQAEKPIGAGAMFGAAAALKAFPAAILPYLIWRRRWRAAAATVLFASAFLLLAPAPFRGFERNLGDVKTWINGMVLSANEKGFGQRPEQNWSWKNNSLIAVTHRFVRPVNFEGEDPSLAPVRVNFLNLTYEEANLAVLALAILIGLGFAAVLPPEARRTAASDGAEFAILVALMTIASPLARAYYFVWLLYPYTVLVYQAGLDPEPRTRRLTWGFIGLSVLLFTAGAPIAKPHWPQALGNMLWACAVVIGALIWRMRASMTPLAGPQAAVKADAASWST